MQTCPKCGAKVEKLRPVDREDMHTNKPKDIVRMICRNCVRGIARGINPKDLDA